MQAKMVKSGWVLVAQIQVRRHAMSSGCGIWRFFHGHDSVGNAVVKGLGRDQGGRTWRCVNCRVPGGSAFGTTEQPCIFRAMGLTA